MHKDVSLPAPAARSELNTGMEGKNQQSQQTISIIIEEKLNSACQILKKSGFFVPIENPSLHDSFNNLFLQKTNLLFWI